MVYFLHFILIHTGFWIVHGKIGILWGFLSNLNSYEKVYHEATKNEHHKEKKTFKTPRGLKKGFSPASEQRETNLYDIPFHRLVHTDPHHGFL